MNPVTKDPLRMKPITQAHQEKHVFNSDPLCMNPTVQARQEKLVTVINLNPLRINPVITDPLRMNPITQVHQEKLVTVIHSDPLRMNPAIAGVLRMNPITQRNQEKRVIDSSPCRISRDQNKASLHCLQLTTDVSKHLVSFQQMQTYLFILHLKPITGLS